MNRIILTGRLTNEPMIYTSEKGSKIASFTLAVDARKKDGSTLFISVKILNNNLADNVSKYVLKGDLVGVDGYLELKTYLNNDNQKKTAYSVIADTVDFLETLKIKKLKEEEEKKQAIFNDEKQDNPISDVNNDDLPF